MWRPAKGETLACRQESTNPHDHYAVSVQKVDQVIGHLPQKISCLCFLFLGQGTTITASVTGERRCSIDLPQGGMEIPCWLTFSGPVDVFFKAKKLIKLLRLETG